MNAPEAWPTAAEVRQWHIDRANKPMTPEELEIMAEEYAREAAHESRDAEDRSVDAAGTFLG